MRSPWRICRRNYGDQFCECKHSQPLCKYKNIKSGDKKGIFGKCYAVKFHPISLWEVFESVWCLTPISNIGKNTQLSHSEFEMCTLELGRQCTANYECLNHQKNRTRARCPTWAIRIPQKVKCKAFPWTRYRLYTPAHLWKRTNIEPS